MTDLFNVITVPLKKIAQLIFSLTIGNTNLGSIIVVGFIFVALISAITHISGLPTGVGRIIRRIKDHKHE